MIELYPIIRPFLQPVIGAFHGWFATRMVVVMLFKPHKVYYFYGKKVPFTPGIFPRRKSALATNIGRTVTETLLTPVDIHNKIEKFINEDNINRIISITIDKFTPTLESAEFLDKIAEAINKFVPNVIDGTATSLIDKIINDKEGTLTKITEYLVEEVFLNIKISEADSSSIINYVFDSFISPVNIRTTLHTSLTPERAINLQSMMREKTTGALKFILSFANLEGIFNNLKDYLQNEPENAEKLIAEIISQLKVREDLVERLTKLDFKKLSVEDIQNIKNSLKNGISNYLKNNQDIASKVLENIKGSLAEIIKEKVHNFKISEASPELLNTIKTKIASFIHQYLEKELVVIVDKGVSKLKIREMIEGKINDYSAQNVEDLILGIMKRELKSLELLGLLIGLFLGIIALAIEYFLPYN